jgi:hypothetical protein
MRLVSFVEVQEVLIEVIAALRTSVIKFGVEFANGFIREKNGAIDDVAACAKKFGVFKCDVERLD